MLEERTRRNWKGVVLVLVMLMSVLGVGAIARLGNGLGLNAPANTTPASTGTARQSGVGATPGGQSGNSTPPSASTPDCAQGTSWRVISSPNKAPDRPGEGAEGGSSLTQIAALSENDVWAVGVVRGEGTSEALIEHWDGAAWHIVPMGQAEGAATVLNAVAVIDSNDVWAVGSHLDKTRGVTPLALHWDGKVWSLTSNPAARSGHRSLTGVSATASGDVWAVGYSIEEGGIYQTLVERWNGGQWNVVASPNAPGRASQLDAVKALARDDVWAVGHYFEEGGVYKMLAEHWDGTAWSIAPSPNVGLTANYPLSVAAASSDDVWAVGYTADAGVVYRTLVEHWDGRAWSIVPSPNNGDRQNVLNSVSVSPLSPQYVWAVGYYLTSQGRYRTLIEKWDGTKWSIVPDKGDEVQDTTFSGVWAIQSADVWAVGYRFSRQAGKQTLIARYNNPCVKLKP